MIRGRSTDVSDSVSARSASPPARRGAGVEGTLRLLALAGLGDGRLQAARVTFDAQLICIDARSRERLVHLEIGEFSPAEKCAARAGRLAVRYVGSGDDRVALGLARAAAGHLAGQRLSALVALLAVDAAPALPSGSTSASREADRLASHHEASWWHLHYPALRTNYNRLRHNLRWVRVHHASLECKDGRVRPSLAATRYFRGEPVVVRESLEVCTALGERDVLGGRTQARLHETVQGLVESASFDLVEIQSTCLPDLIGDQPAAVAGAVAQGTPHIVWQCKTDQQDRRLLRQFLDARLSRLGASGERDRTRVVLAGAEGDTATELGTWLARMGVAVEGSLLPEVDLSATAAQHRAAWLVWVDPRGWEWLGEEGLRRAFTVVEGAPPFGLQGTLAWLQRVGEVVGLVDAAARVRQLAVDIEELRLRTQARCARHRAAVIGDLSGVMATTTPQAQRPFAIVGLLREMGFEVRVLLYDPVARPVSAALRDVVGGADAVRCFATQAELDEQLGEVALALSSFNHDPRLAAHAVVGFDGASFLPGVEGFARSAARLCALAERRPFPEHRHLLRGWVQ